MLRYIEAEDGNVLFLKEIFIWSKIYRVVNHSVNMGVVEIQAGNFPEKEQLFRKFRATCGQGCQLLTETQKSSFYNDIPHFQRFQPYFVNYRSCCVNATIALSQSHLYIKHISATMRQRL